MIFLPPGILPAFLCCCKATVLSALALFFFCYTFSLQSLVPFSLSFRGNYTTVEHLIQYCLSLFPVDVNHVFLAPLSAACREWPLSFIFSPEGSWISDHRAAPKVADAVNSPELCLAFYRHHVILFIFFIQPTRIYLSTSYVQDAGATQ